MITINYKTSIVVIAFLALALSLSCAHKKSAIEQLIVQKQTDETKIKSKAADKKQNDISNANVEIESPQEEIAQGDQRVTASRKEGIEEQTIMEIRDSISKAISNITEKLQETKKEGQMENHIEEESLPAPPESIIKTSKALSIAQKKSQKIPEPALPKKIQKEEDVSLNFEETDIKDIIITFCDLLKIDYIMDPGISGKITLQTFNKVKVSDLFHILEKILVLNNLTVIKTGNFYRFMQIEPAKKESLNVFFGKDSDAVPLRDRLIIQIMPLEHISIESVKSIIAPLLSQHASFLDVPGTNNLIIIDTANNVKRLLKIIEIIDVKAIDTLQVNLYPLQYSDARTFAANMKNIFDALGYASVGPSATPTRAKSKIPSKAKPKSPFKTPRKPQRKTPFPSPFGSAKISSKDRSTAINFVPVEKINSLLVVNPFPELSPDIELWISRLDKPTKVFFGKDITLLPSQGGEGKIIQIIPLTYVASDSIKNIIAPLLTQQSSILTVPNRNNLIIIDFAGNINQALEIINILDVSSLDKLQIKLFPLEFSDAEEIAAELKEIFDSLGYIDKDKTMTLKFVPIERLNSLLIVNHFPKLLPDIEFWISRLDKPSIAGLEEKTYVYYIQNAKAEELAALLTQIYQKSATEQEEVKKKRKKSRPKAKTHFAKAKIPVGKKEKAVKKKSTLAVEVKSTLRGEVSGEIIIIPDKFTNALIIRTLPVNFPAILDTIKLLDLMPQQVLIEVLVLELTIDEQTRAGLDWAFRAFRKEGNFAAGNLPTMPGDVFQPGISATSLLTQGFSFIAQSDELFALFQAFAQDSKLNVLSNPILITSENMPASINITNDIPIETSTITTPTGGTPVISTTVQYKSVGIKLDITPRINKERFVDLQISQESSNVDTSASFSQPAFFTRSTNTNVVIKDKQTLVIGGLMETTKSHSDSGVPFLKDIPILGRLFTVKSDRVRKTELIIFITPHVISNVSEANEVTKAFRSKLLHLKKNLKLEKNLLLPQQ